MIIKSNLLLFLEKTHHKSVSCPTPSPALSTPKGAQVQIFFSVRIFLLVSVNDPLILDKRKTTNKIFLENTNLEELFCLLIILKQQGGKKPNQQGSHFLFPTGSYLFNSFHSKETRQNILLFFLKSFLLSLFIDHQVPITSLLSLFSY